MFRLRHWANVPEAFRCLCHKRPREQSKEFGSEAHWVLERTFGRVARAQRGINLPCKQSCDVLPIRFERNLGLLEKPIAVGRLTITPRVSSYQNSVGNSY